jgi:hypothetical protein
VCDARHSELIPCLDRGLHYQLRLRLNLSLMEHYERHCPPAPRRLNCLIPPPDGYQVREKPPCVTLQSSVVLRLLALHLVCAALKLTMM